MKLEFQSSPSRGSICVTAYSRPQDLERCLTRIISARGNLDLPLILLHQIGFPEVEKVITDFRSEIQVLIQFPGLGKSALQNINLNAIIAREFAFNSLNAAWCVGIEEDVEIASDTFDFGIAMFEKYKANKRFRGVNFGSLHEYSEEKLGHYTKTRYGLHGQASLITRDTWKHFNVNRLIAQSETIGLDAMMEHYLKSGFFCMPYVSRYVDNGWNGTHASRDSKNIYYLTLQRSFGVGFYPTEINYSEKKFPPNWRKDCTNYSFRKIAFLQLRDFLMRAYYQLKKGLKNLFNRSMNSLVV